MPKEIPDCPKKPNPEPEASRRYEIELITPMVGGGADPGNIDPLFPIRPTAIRGHLRHWWRLTVGHLLGDGMWQREEEIFGSTEFSSPVTVSIGSFTKIQPFDPSNGDVVDRFGPVAYALFASIENGHQVAKEGIKFNLMVRSVSQDGLSRRRKAQNEQRRKAGRKPLSSTIDAIDRDL